GVPTMYARLAEAADPGPLRGLRLCVSGSAALAADPHARLVARRRQGLPGGVWARRGQGVVERYGMTEPVMLVSNPADGERRPGTVGLPLPGVEVRLPPPPPADPGGGATRVFRALAARAR